MKYVQLVDKLSGQQESHSDSPELLTSNEGGVFTLKMNRPTKKNALSVKV